MTTQSINLNVIPGGVLPRVNVSQYDKGLEQIVATLYEGSSAFTMPSSATVYVQGTKKDGTGFQYACSYSSNVITIDLTDQMTVFAGEVVTELVIFDSSNNRIATCNFIINVEKTALSDDTQVSETDLPILQQIPEYAETAHQWATYGSDSEEPSSTNNSKYWAEQSQIYAQGALHWKGSIAFASIPTSNLTVGDMYNITNDFTTDSRFIEGSGKKCAAGTNIVWSDSSKWDILTSATYASQVKYSNTDSGLSATNTQDAIDELNTDLTELNSNLTVNIITPVLGSSAFTMNKNWVYKIGRVIHYDIEFTTGSATYAAGLGVFRTVSIYPTIDTTGVSQSQCGAIYSGGKLVATCATSVISGYTWVTSNSTLSTNTTYRFVGSILMQS